MLRRQQHNSGKNSEKAVNNENLKPFPKGVSGNPNGRPKKIPAIDDLLADVLGKDEEGLVVAKKILEALAAKAMKGDVKAAEVLLDRGYGKAKQTFDGTFDMPFVLNGMRSPKNEPLDGAEFHANGNGKVDAGL